MYRLLIILSTAIAAIAFGALGVPPTFASASVEPIRDCSLKNTEKWAENCDGWQLRIRNDSGVDIEYTKWAGPPLISSAGYGISSKPDMIEAGSEGLVLGNVSGLVGKGPANLLIYFSSEVPSNYRYKLYRYVQVKSFSSPGIPNIVCGYYSPMLPIGYGENKRCEIVKSERNQQLEVRFLHYN